MSWERVDICSIWSACGKRLARNADLPILLDGGEVNSSLSLSLSLSAIAHSKTMCWKTNARRRKYSCRLVGLQQEGA